MCIFDPFGAAATAAERRSAGRARTPSLRSSRGLPALCRNTPAIVTHVSHKGIHFAGFRNACRMFLIGAGRIGHYLLELERVMNTFPVLLGALCVYALAYRYYSAFIAAKALALDDRRITPGHTYASGHNYVASPRWVLFGHHFAAIAGAGPLVGPTLAAQFGFAPGFLWLLIGAVVAGCVQDFTVLVASIRHRGRSLADIARTEISPFAGLVAMIAVLFILLVTLGGLGIVVVNALANSPWGVFTIGSTIPIALIMGIWMFKSHAGKITVMLPSIVGVVLLMAALIGGRSFSLSSHANVLMFNAHQITYLMAIYGFGASILPVWLLLEPRDYL